MKSINSSIILALALISPLLLTSCASIFSGSRARVTISAKGDAYATNDLVNIRTDVKTYTDVSLPCKVKIKRRSKPSRIYVTSDKYLYDDILVHKKFNHIFWANILFGGIIGMGVDAATGAWYKPTDKYFLLNSYAKEKTPIAVSNSTNKQIVVVPANQPQKSAQINSPIIQLNNNEEKTQNASALTLSDVDVNIPVINKINEQTYVVIIANENYESEVKVPYARNDGKIFSEYCRRTLGVPKENIDFFENASYNNMRKAISNAKMFADIAGTNAKIIFYYAGHGIPDEANKTAYLLPIDGYGSDIATGYKLDELYNQLGSLKVKNTTIFIDACFSGSKREGDKLASARGIAIKVTPSRPQGNMVVFTASSGDETAYYYKEQSHGLFTYFLLKKLQESSGKVSYSELFNYLEKNVKLKSFQVNRKIQTPTVLPATNLTTSWKQIQFNN